MDFMRIAITEVKQECNTFSPIEATLKDFKNEHILEGESIVRELRDTNTEIGGFIQRATELGMDIVPLFAASALSGGRISFDSYNYIFERVINNLKAELPVDGVFLALHGAMCANVEGGDDATGLLLKGVRELVGFDIPIIATLDLHANVTRLMMEMADALIGNHTWPHVDQSERGQEAAEMMIATIKKKTQPVTVISKLRMILQVENGQTSMGPMAELISSVKRLVNEGSCLSGSVFLVQPWMDLPNMGCAVVIVGNNDRKKAQALADELGRKMWDLRHEFDVKLTPVDDAIDYALSSSEHPFVFADVADSTGSGTPGDSTAILKRLIERDIDCKVFITIVDAEAVNLAHQVGKGERLDCLIGAKTDQVNFEPVYLHADVEWVGKNVEYKFEGPVYNGLRCELGDVAVLKQKEVYLLVTKRPVWTHDPEMYRAVNLEPTEAKIIVVKSQNSFKAAYKNIAQKILIVDTPGLSTSNIRSIKYNHIQRPFYPFNDDWPGAPWDQTK